MVIEIQQIGFIAHAFKMQTRTAAIKDLFRRLWFAKVAFRVKIMKTC